MQTVTSFGELTAAAIFFHDHVQSLIDKYPDWWGKVDGKADEKFGEYILKAQKQSEQLGNSTFTDKLLPTIIKKTDDLTGQMADILSFGSTLENNYKNNKQPKDAGIVRQFVDLASNTHDQFWKISSDLKKLLEEKSTIKQSKGINRSNTVNKKSIASSSETVEQVIEQSPQSSNPSDPHPQNNITNYIIWLDLPDPGAIERFDNALQSYLSYEPTSLLKASDRGILIFNSQIPVIHSSIVIQNNDNNNGRFSFKTDQVFNPLVVVDEAKKIFPGLQMLTKPNSTQPIKDYAITKQEYDDLLLFCINGFIGERFNTSSLSAINPDTSSREIIDQLDFESDVTAMASVIAYEKVQPPLAIGLFGNWGSGKSFFMNKLQVKIKELADNDDATYCSKVVHVNFNSWHYSDANLWASLITKIFEDLQQYAKGGKQTMDTLYQNLNSTKELIDESKVKLERVSKEKENLETAQKTLQQTIDDNASALESTKT
ncbi:MAG: P-loop NTPase fold protein, partial [Chitinophagaceae bacterium]